MVLKRITEATEGITGDEANRALQDELDMINKELQANPNLLKGEW
jgi:hypothetical protein